MCHETNCAGIRVDLMSKSHATGVIMLQLAYTLSFKWKQSTVK